MLAVNLKVSFKHIETFDISLVVVSKTGIQ